jgi:hypothetical protein
VSSFSESHGSLAFVDRRARLAGGHIDVTQIRKRVPGLRIQFDGA